MAALGYALAGQGRRNDAYQIFTQAQALLNGSDETLQSTEPLRQLLDRFRRALDKVQHGLAETGSDAASIPP